MTKERTKALHAGEKIKYGKMIQRSDERQDFREKLQVG